VSRTLFPNISSSPYRIKLSVAWGADLTDLDGSTYVWTEITDRVAWDEEPITITIGRQDESDQTNPAEFRCRLINWDGYFSHGGISPNFPYVRRNTPVKLEISTDSGTTYKIKYQGNAVGWTPMFDEVNKWATVALFSSGPLRQLNQGTLQTISTMKEGTMADSGVVEYFPLEGGQQSDDSPPAKGTGDTSFVIYDPATKTNIPGVPGDWNSYSGIVSSSPMLTMADGGELAVSFGQFVGTTSITASLLVGNIDRVRPSEETINTTTTSTGTTTTTSWNTNDTTGGEQCGGVMMVWTGNGHIKGWDIDVGANSTGTNQWSTGNLEIAGHNADNPATFQGSDEVFRTNINFGMDPNTDWEIGLDLNASGGTTTYRLWILNLEDGTSSYYQNTVSNSGTNPVACSGFQIGQYATSGGLAVGHLILHATSIGSLGYDKAWAMGYPSELWSDRMDRLCDLVGQPYEILDDANYETDSTSSVDGSGLDFMGTQHVDTFSNLMREIEATQLGILFDGLGLGLQYVARKKRMGQPVAITLDAMAKQVTVADPIDDEENSQNDVTCTRRGGNSYFFVDTTSQLGVPAIGDYQESYAVNPDNDNALPSSAEWYVHLGTLEGYRYPTVSFALHFQPSLIANWLSCIPSSRLDVVNLGQLRPQQHDPNAPLRLCIEGWTETITPWEWFVNANTSRWGWNVGRLAAATGSTGDSVMRRDTDGSATNAAYAAGATSVQVKLTATGCPLWTTAADDFPLQAEIGGNFVVVTGIAGTSSPQTFTLASPGLPYAVPANALVRLWNPPVLGP
jgi:hypothetical protein